MINILIYKVYAELWADNRIKQLRYTYHTHVTSVSKTVKLFQFQKL